MLQSEIHGKTDFSQVQLFQCSILYPVENGKKLFLLIIFDPFAVELCLFLSVFHEYILYLKEKAKQVKMFIVKIF